MRLLICMMVVVAGLSACSNEPPNLKSPCVGLEDSPCGPKRPANGWLTSSVA